MRHLCVSKLTSIASDNGLSPGRHQAITWNNARILLIGPLETYFSEILIEIQTFSLKKICLKILSAKCRPFCLGLNVLNQWWPTSLIYASLDLDQLTCSHDTEKLHSRWGACTFSWTIGMNQYVSIQKCHIKNYKCKWNKWNKEFYFMHK